MAPSAHNQTPPLVDYNLLTTDDALSQGVAREGAAWALSELTSAGAELGAAENFERARLANAYPPVLRAFDARGERIDRVEFHPAWHELLSGITARGLHTGPWAQARPGAHVARAGSYLMQAQIESGTLCPTTMTYGAVAAIRQDADLARQILPVLYAPLHDPRELPLAAKRGAMIGMGMTEKQGGSDVRTNITRALRQPDGSYRLDGHKWFFSAPQCDAHLVLAQTERGLSCLFVPRYTADGVKNGVHIQRLKDKVGNRSNASSEVEFVAAHGRLLGEEGRGVPTILEMGTYTRLDCVIGSAGMMRQAVVQALHHAGHRTAFGRPLIEQPLMRSVLVDLVIESEAATALALRLARAFESEQDERERWLRRVMTSAGKFWVCKRGPALAAEAMEVLGGNGYVEEAVLGRIYREMPVNSIWEGSGNIMCLDVLRAFSKSAQAAPAVLAELELARGLNARYDAALAALAVRLSGATSQQAKTGSQAAGAGLQGPGAVAQGAGAALQEAAARTLVRDLVLVFQGALLLRSSRTAVAEAFCESRFAAGWGAVFGEMPAGGKSREILDAAWREES
jgi:putative acyl-CoA dehydrogenase